MTLTDDVGTRLPLERAVGVTLPRSRSLALMLSPSTRALASHLRLSVHVLTRPTRLWRVRAVEPVVRAPYRRWSSGEGREGGNDDGGGGVCVD